MLSEKTPNDFSRGPLVVGTIHSAASLRAALRLKRGAIDLFEVRLDAFADDSAALLRAAAKLTAPIIATARDPREGGAGRLSANQRRALYVEAIPFARFIDVELRNAPAFAPLLGVAREDGLGVIASFHDFRRTPTAATLATAAVKARSVGADLLKVAAHTSTAGDLATLLTFLKMKRMPLSVMGMGPLGKISRLLFGRTGSVLNYGYLGEPQVSGQWPALLLKERLRELEAQP